MIHSDISEARLEVAKKLGADMIFKPSRNEDPKQAGLELRTALGEEADLCVECSGAKGTVDASIHACRPGGKVMMVGFGDMAMYAHIGMAAVREIDILGAFANVNNYPECINLVASGKVDVKSAISHRLPLEQVKDGMELIRRGESTKVVIDCS
ncbi:sorbitol dehydrogenase [Aplysia californica]|uniref:Sorbitol dehydrogenase n=1 Tax=Aplysia californica TaxID=6500 RepID=A0ABM0JDT9_APLCA|nr:sorbitol dehydrogenase [Aplysia californica]